MLADDPLANTVLWVDTLVCYAPADDDRPCALRLGR
jgi:hypothetical protein